MKDKTIIIYTGRANEGKSSTLIEVCRRLITPSTPVLTYNNQPINFSRDVLASIRLGKIKIGIESQGDPGSRMIMFDTIRYLADAKFSIKGFQAGLGDCDIIICASRTAGATVKRIDQIAARYNYRTLWKGSYYAPGFSHASINNYTASEIIHITNEIILNRL